LALHEDFHPNGAQVVASLLKMTRLLSSYKFNFITNENKLSVKEKWRIRTERFGKAHLPAAHLYKFRDVVRWLRVAYCVFCVCLGHNAYGIRITNRGWQDIAICTLRALHKAESQVQ
jgi:hypothetical protein